MEDNQENGTTIGTEASASRKSRVSGISIPTRMMAEIETGEAVSLIQIRTSPPRDEYVMVRCDEDYVEPNVPCINGKVIKQNNALFVVNAGDPKKTMLLLQDKRVRRETKLYSFHLAQTTEHVNFIWALRHPGSGEDSWAKSARTAMKLAEKGWVRVMSSGTGQMGGYECVPPEEPLDIEPLWPTMPFDELCGIAMADCRIEGIDHAILRKLRGLY